ncbi:MAG: OmpA family protein [Nannocystales bacterium]
MRRSMFGPAVALSIASCVPKADYDEAKSQLAEARQALLDAGAEEERQGRELGEVRATLARYEAELEAAHQEAATLRRELEMTAVQRDARAAELANAMNDQDALQASIEAMTQALAEANERELAAERRVYEFKTLLARFQTLIDAGKLRIKIVDGRMVLELPTDILFGSGSASLSAEGESALQEVGAVLAEMSDRSFQVEGHTDDVPIDTKRFGDNWELAAARALGVRATLEAAGMKPSQLSAASFADTHPVAGNGTPEGKGANRRIEIVLRPDLSALPGAEELEALETRR